MTPPPNTYKNRMLRTLPVDILQRWSPRLELVDMALGSVLYESGVKPAYVYFPEDAIISMLFVLENGSSAEIAVVGFEGMVGISLFMGGNSTPSRAVIQSAGKVWRLPSTVMLAEFNDSPPVMHLCLRFTQALITQMTQELIANMLGVRREGVTEAAGRLQKAGLISYTRGRIKVLDRPALEQRSCECYQVVKMEYDRLLPDRVAV
jgi:CRP-like cAMP-binding protein